MKLLKAPFAVIQGCRYCFNEPAVRKLAMWPWLIGLVTYIAAFIGAYKLHPSVVTLVADAPTGFLSYLIYGFAWLVAWLALLIAALVITVGAVLVFASAFQTAIAAKVLKLLGREVPNELGIVAEAGRSIKVEAIKLLWIGPLIAAAFLIGLIPWLLPFAAIAGSWLLGYQFVDISLDLYRLTNRQRIGFGRRHGWTIAAFGFGIGLIAAIPFAGFILPPIGAAAAAWLLHSTKLLDELPKA